MQKGLHIGKILVTFPDDPHAIPTTPTVQKIELRPDASYLLVGGLGGLGRSVSNWMVEHGARHLTFLSRSAGTSVEDKAFLYELELQGCSAQAVAGTVEDPDAVNRAVEVAARPVAGIIQLSMVLKDRPFMIMSYDDWKQAVGPKVTGTWNLHAASKNCNLDFFVLLASISGIFGNPGQANYAAANTYLDAFVQYRHQKGLPASVIDLGLMGEIGSISKNPKLVEAMCSRGWYSVKENDLLQALNLSMWKSSPKGLCLDRFRRAYFAAGQMCTGILSTKALSNPENILFCKRDRRLGLFRNGTAEVSKTSTSGDDDLVLFISSIEENLAILDSSQSRHFLMHAIGIRIYEFMLQPVEEIDVSISLKALGVDSLVTIEIRNWWRRNLGIEISVLEILNAGTIEALGELAVQRLRAKVQSKPRERMDEYLVARAP
jgi:aryl carrier-like protein